MVFGIFVLLLLSWGTPGHFVMLLGIFLISWDVLGALLEQLAKALGNNRHKF